MEIARNLSTGGRSTGCTCYHDRARMKPPHEARVRYYVVLSVTDQPGVLATVAGVFAAHEISIASVRQEGIGEEASLTLITHAGTEGSHDETFAELETLDVVRRIDSRLRVAGTAEV